MIWNYADTPTIWPSVGTSIFLLILAAYSWHRRSVPGALALAISCLFAVLIAVGEFMAHPVLATRMRLGQKERG